MLWWTLGTFWLVLNGTLPYVYMHIRSVNTCPYASAWLFQPQAYCDENGLLFVETSAKTGESVWTSVSVMLALG